MTLGILLARSGEGWKSGPWGLAIILLLCVASYFLFKSMSKHLRKVREEFPTDDPGTPPTPPAAPGDQRRVASDGRPEVGVDHVTEPAPGREPS